MSRKKMPVIVKKLRRWQADNGSLSARQTATVMNERGFLVSYRTIESWESQARAPGRFAAQALEKFLEEHPTVDDAPRYQRYKISPAQITEILALRKQDQTLRQIAQKFGISESSVSRICSGSRRAK